jgi:dienelactone hydrolase
MKPVMTLAALLISACAGSAPESSTDGKSAVAGSCAVARPDFGGVATAADRALFAYDVNAPLNLQKTVVSTKNDVETSAISFDSPSGGAVTGFLFDPVTRSSLRPGIVAMHGAPGEASQMAPYAQQLAELGAVVIAIDAPFARRLAVERRGVLRRGGDWIQFSAEDRAEQIQLIKDLQRAVDVLRTRSNVDEKRIAYLGISYGGHMGALLVGIERRLKAAVLVVGYGGLVTAFTNPEELTFMARLSCERRGEWFRAMAPIEPIRFIPHASPTALLLQNGRTDYLDPAADAQLMHAAAPEPKTIRWYDAGHGLNVQAVWDRHDWLHEQIGLDPRQ